MITVCWAAKGGSGTTTVAALLALVAPRPVLLVDLDGEVLDALGAPLPAAPGVLDWVRSEAPGDHLADLLVDAGGEIAVLPQPPGDDAADVRRHGDPTRWAALAAWLADRAASTNGTVVVDAGTGAPPEPLLDLARQVLLVTRPCYLALRRAARIGVRPTGIVLVRDHGRALRVGDVARSIGAPIVARIDTDPAVARAIDSGLLTSRLPGAVRRQLARAAA